MAEYWQGDDGEYYSKDEYGNVFNSAGEPIGNDAPDYGYDPNYGAGLPSQFNAQESGYNPQTGIGTGVRPPNVPSNFTYNPANQTWNAPGMGGGQQGVGVQPGIDWAKLQLDRDSLNSKIQQNQAYQAYLNQQLQQQALTDSQRLAIDRERVQIERENQALRVKQFELEKQADEFKRGMEISQTLANPRNLVQSLMLLGATPAQAAGYLQQTPLVQGLGAGTGTGQEYGWAPPPGGINLQNVQQAFGGMPDYQAILKSTSAAAGGGSVDPSTGLNTLFPFMGGRKLPVQQTLTDLAYNPEKTGALASLASFSGRNPDTFFGEFEQFLPKGATAGPTAMR